MAVAVSVEASLQSGLRWNHSRVKVLPKNLNQRSQLCLLVSTSPRMLKTRSSLYLVGANQTSPLQEQQYSWNANISKRFPKRASNFLCKSHAFECKCSLNQGLGLDTAFSKNAALYFAWLCKNWPGSRAMVVRLAPTFGILMLTICGLGPVMNHSMNICWNKSNSSGEKSITYHATTSHNQFLFPWVRAVTVCRALQPMIPPTGFGQLVINFLNSVFGISAYVILCMSMLSSIEGEVQDLVVTKFLGFGYVDIALSIVGFMISMILYGELLGYSNEKLGIARYVVLLLLLSAGCEIFKNSLPSAIKIGATRPFDVIQTEGYEVSRITEMGPRFDSKAVFIVGLCAVLMVVIQLLDPSIGEWLSAALCLFTVSMIFGPVFFKLFHICSTINATRQVVVTEGIQINVIEEGYEVFKPYKSFSRSVFIAVLASVVWFFLPSLVSSEWVVEGLRILIAITVHEYVIYACSLSSSMT